MTPARVREQPRVLRPVRFTGRISRKSRRTFGGSAIACCWARVLKSGANLLLLDEPTNDLDVNSIRALAGVAGKFRRLCGDHLDTTGGFSTVWRRTSWRRGDSYVHWFAGNYSSYLGF